MGGTLAQFSREGIVRELAQRLTDTFAANLRRKLEASEEAVTSVETVDAGSTQPFSAIAGAMDAASILANAPLSAGATLAPQPSASPTSLNFGSLLWAVIVDRVRRWFGRKPRS
jgi:hypothetical protein